MYYFKRLPLFFLIFCFNVVMAQLPGQLKNKRVLLPNGWSLSPAGKSLPLGDLPLNIAVSPSGKLMAVTNNGQSTQTIDLIDPVQQKVLDTIVVGKSWMGLTFSSDSRFLYASGGNDNWILRFAIRNNKLVPSDTLRLGKPWPALISPAGMALDDAHHLLYVVTKENNSLYVLNTKSKKVVHHFPLGGEGYTCLLSPDKKMLYISCWGCDKVQLFDTRKQAFAGDIPVGDNPNDMCMSKNGNWLFVANSNDNSVSVIDLKKDKVVETLNAALYPNAPEGSTTNGVALSADQKTLYIANADNNCLSVFDVSDPGNSKSKGFIPVGWYPTCVRIVGNTIFVANGKGMSSMANPHGPNPTVRREKVVYQKGENGHKEKVQYIAGLFRGTLSMIPTPDAKQLGVYSQQVYQNTPYKTAEKSEAKGSPNNPIPEKVGGPSPIKYVFYIIKENRTYDQVLGDMPQGNGDTSLVLFGKKITPNQHALANQFVLCDNFYTDAEVSADGHNWSTGAYATDYLEKTWPTSYGGRGGRYDAEGNRAIANNKPGFIWNFCKRYGVSYRTYAEFMTGEHPNIPVLQGHFCPYYTSWNQSVRDTTRYYEWKRDFDSLLAINKVPQLSTLRFINDHTEGLRVGKPTPFAQVADNDLAVGLFLDHLSHSKIWKQSAVFIVEDDAQNGPDHVDAHRSTLYVAGGYVKRHYVDHTMYSTSSVLRTIELILGLPPMSQYDAAATPMWKCFSDSANVSTFTALPSNVNLNKVNLAVNKWSKESAHFDFAKEDEVPMQEFNEVLWEGIKGQPCPAPKHAAFIAVHVKKNQDDDDR